MKSYQEFIKSKSTTVKPIGIYVNSLHDGLFDFQKACVKKALELGRCALFEGCGLGKTRQQLEWAMQVHIHTGGDILIVAPLGVTRQTALEEAPQMGYKVTICRTQDDVKNGINITNYEMIDKFDTSKFIGVVLDESSILKNFTGSIRTKLSKAFKETPYKLCCTATPAPNDMMELLNHADFLDVMSTAQALSIYFINDMKTGTWRLKGHATKEFYKWCCQWSINIETPADIGFDGTKYVLPELCEKEEILKIDLIDDTFENGLFRNIETSATAFHKEKKRTAEQRAKRCAELVCDGNQYLIWCDTNDEADHLKKYIPEAVEVRGADKPQFKEDAAEKFKNGEIRVLISKPKIFGYGMNFQKCHKVIFCGLTYSYENYYQALRRIYRFGQIHKVTCWLVLGSTELHILDVVRKKQRQQEELKNNMDQSLKEIQRLEFEGKEKTLIMPCAEIKVPDWL